MKRLRFLFTVFLLWHASPAHAASYEATGDLIGAIRYYSVSADDNLYAIARKFDIGIVELLAANPGIDPWQPPAGTRLAIVTSHILPPTMRKGIVINLSELRLFYYGGDGQVMSFPIGIGREGWQTPLGVTRIARKRKDPVWTPPASIRLENPDLPEMIPAGPDNPMGAYALSLDWPNIAIHGTNRPFGVGKRSSHGCIRLYPEDIETLFGAVKIKTPVTVVDMPFKLGWQGDALFLEITPTQNQADVIAEYQQPDPMDIPEIYDAINAEAGEHTDVSWYEVERAIIERNGIPVLIGKTAHLVTP